MEPVVIAVIVLGGISFILAVTLTVARLEAISELGRDIREMLENAKADRERLKARREEIERLEVKRVESVKAYEAENERLKAERADQIKTELEANRLKVETQV